MTEGNRRRKNRADQCPLPQKFVRQESDSLGRRKVFSKNVNRLLSTCSLVIIKGPICCGKSFCATEASQLSGLPLNVVQVNEDFDVKTLFGSYKCTDIPGKFVWVPSFFAKCLKTDCYILLEKLDTGSPDLVATVLTLCEKREYTLYSGEQCFMHENCRILATITTGRDGSLNLIRDYPFFVEIPSFNELELNNICSKHFPCIDSIMSKILKLFKYISNLIATKCPSDRQLNPKDLFRLCKRLNRISDSLDNLLFVKEICDVCLMHLPNKTHRFDIALKVAEEFSVSVDQLHTLFDVTKPELTADVDFVRLGRAMLHRKHNSSVRTHSFGLTRECCQLIERIGVAISWYEPVLLTGETGVGKTSVVQLIADYCGIDLKIVNMSQDSEFADLIGGFKPTPVMDLIRPLGKEYIRLFQSTFNVKKNSKFLTKVKKCLNNEQILDFLKVVIQTGTKAAHQNASIEWANLVVQAKRILHYVESSSCVFPFTFVKGIVSKATEFGHWLLIDEINLASSECLDAVMQIVDSEKVHPNFRLFACMNPATDVGKRFLSINVRSQFAEFFVTEPTEKEQLEIIIRNYLPNIDLVSMNSIWTFYQEIQNNLPRKYSLRTLCRALKIIANNAKIKDQRKMFPLGFTISFTSNLDSEEQSKLRVLVQKHFGKISNPITFMPSSVDMTDFVKIENSYIRKGSERPTIDERFIFTPSVQANLAFLASVVANGQFPILLEGETSAGKTSMIQFLAKSTGNRVYRINNHEHTDIQEYIGSYSPNVSGHIEFVEGILLKAVRNGDWIILDELNLAPSIVLEALNRLLDDNREIYVPELNTTVVAHPQFRLFATQNPVGHYAGRKRLSAAFLNRFVIIKYNHLPFTELPKILEGRCGVAASVAQKMVEVLEELKSRRSVHGIFSFSNGLMTLRDLFRWGVRVTKEMEVDCDWRQMSADQGYFVLASRCRSVDDEKMVIDVLEKCLKRKIDCQALFSVDSKYIPKEIISKVQANHVVLTYSMRRMIVLCSEAWKFNEAVLLVGETGCGKTTVAHLLDELLWINCHERTETSDFLGNIRPTTDGKFQWNDGVVIQAMKQGNKILIDEISLAPDSVLERLNSLLETDRTILLTDGVIDSEVIVAKNGFQLIATMNPGDDHGKKELSKALRNRFLEIWCPGNQLRDEMQLIMDKRLHVYCSSSTSELIHNVSACFIHFFEYFGQNFSHIFKTMITIRDLINMGELFSNCLLLGIPVPDSLFHSISANLFDSFGVVPTRISFNREKLINECIEKLKRILVHFRLGSINIESLNCGNLYNVKLTSDGLHIAQFFIPYGQCARNVSVFAFDAPTSSRNLLCVARGMASTKPIMLEGSPGAGKSSLIVALAAATGHPLVRLNLSEQTDLNDLFGGDVPAVTDDGETTFIWKDGPVLKAIKNGSWILLDEMNLASQSVLEGLNSCFDFRKQLHISELNKTFDIECTKCHFFACQNPRSQGGDRKALPKSFLNRFTSIYVNEMTDSDFIYVLNKVHGNELHEENILSMVKVNRQILQLAIYDGGPFEFNLRDLLRWACALKMVGAEFGFELVYISRLRNDSDIEKFRKIFTECFEDNKFGLLRQLPSVSETQICGNGFTIPLDKSFFNDVILARILTVLNLQIEVLRKLSLCVDLNWLSLLVGDFSSGMRSSIEILANLANKKLYVLRLTSETDSLELLGSYEQIVDGIDLITLRSNFVRILKRMQTENKKIDCNFFTQASTDLTASELHTLVQQVSVIYADKELEDLSQSLSNVGNARFQWIDSSFVNAYKNGYWILVQDVNCCSSAVLDCLNSCLEDCGELVIPEHSSYESMVIKKHPDFRVFFSMDPRNGLLSRAMRNRSVEIFFGRGSFWNSSLEPFFNSEFDDRRIEQTSLNWITSTSLSESLKEQSLQFITADNCIKQKIEMFFEQFLVPDKICRLFHTSGEFVERNYGNSVIQFGLCYPFASEQEFTNYSLNYIECISCDSVAESESSFLCLSNEFNDFFLTLYTLLGEKFNLKKNSVDYLHNLRALPWISNQTRDIFSSLESFSKNFGAGEDMGNVFCFLNSSFLTILANKLWNIFGFTVAPKWAQLKDFTKLTAHLGRLRNAFWKITFLNQRIRSGIKYKLQQIGDRFYLKEFSSCTSYSFSNLLGLLRTTLSLLKSLTPPLNSCDASIEIFTDLKSRTDQEKLRIVTAFFRCFKYFLNSIMENCDESFFENLKYPILDLLWKSDKFSSGQTILSTDQDISSIFRPTDLKFHQLAKYLNEFVELFSNFQQSVFNKEITDALVDDNISVSSGKFSLLKTQIESFLKSSNFFKCKLLKEFDDYPDIVIAFAAIMDIMTVVLCCLLRKVATLQNYFVSFQQYHFPQVTNDVWNMKDLESIAEWCIGSTSILPLTFQLDVVNWQLSKVTSPPKLDLCFRWILKNWRVRYEKCLEKNSELFVYKSRANDSDNNENDIPDEDKIEFDSYFPDYSGTDFDEDNEEKHSYVFVPRDYNNIPDNELVGVLYKLMNRTKVVSIEKNFPYFLYVKLIEELRLYDYVLEDEHYFLKYQHLIHIWKVENFLTNIKEKKNDNAFNVYAENNYAETCRCVEAIGKLKLKIDIMHNEFPENQILVNILDVIEKFLSIPTTMPLMRLTTLLERLLVAASEWQQLADRAHSIQNELLDLQHILVDWRRLEVMCWSNIIERIEQDFKQSALICSFPLFDSFEKLLTDTTLELMERENKIILMLIDWIQNASLIDYDVRLLSGELLANYIAHQASLLTSQLQFSSTFSLRVSLVVNYFKIFEKSFLQKFAQAKSDVETKLKDFVEIFQYNDLNLWSVKQSTQKVHAQLFRIIKKFKDCCREPIKNFLFEEALPYPSSEDISINNFQFNSSIDNELSSKMCLATEKINYLLSKCVNVESLASIQELSQSLLETLNKDILYNGTDEEKEKQQGRALFERQKMFSFLIKNLGTIGLSSRRGLQVNSESLTMSSMSMVDLDSIPKFEIANFIRHSVSSRNMFFKKMAGLRLNQADHIRKQVSTAMFSHLKGITEFGLFWSVNAAQYLAGDLCSYVNEFNQFSADISILKQNLEEHYALDNVEVHDFMNESKTHLSRMLALVNLLQDVVRACPNDQNESSEFEGLEHLTSEIGVDSLAELNKSSECFKKLHSAIFSTKSALDEIYGKLLSVKPTTNGIWKASEISSIKSEIQIHFQQFRSHSLCVFAKYFTKETEELDLLSLSVCTKANDLQLKYQPINTIDCGDSTSILLQIQQLFKKINGKAESVTKSKKLLDFVKELIELMPTVNLEMTREKFVELLGRLSNQSLSKPSMKDLETSQILVDGLSTFLNCILEHLLVFIRQYSVCYLQFEAIAFRLVSNGFVNTIPKAENDSCCNSKCDEISAGENCGMGNADNAQGAGDAQDVSDQLDNMGQIEGLKDEAQKENLDDEKLGDSEQPIEMEDDFVANLENLDGEEVDENEDPGNNENEMDDKIDWEKGDVEEPEERQLDPELWDKPLDKEKPEEVDDDNADAADKGTNDMVAKDSESASIDKENQEFKDNEDENDLSDGCSIQNNNDDNDINMDDDDDIDAQAESNDIDKDEGQIDPEDVVDDSGDVNAENTEDEKQQLKEDGNEENEADDKQKEALGIGKFDEEKENKNGGKSDPTENADVDAEKNKDEMEMEISDEANSTNRNSTEEQEKKTQMEGEERSMDKSDAQKKVENENKNAESERRKGEIANEDEVDLEFQGKEAMEIGDEENEDGDDETFSANQNQSHGARSHKLIVQDSTIDEATKTKELYNKFDHSLPKDYHEDKAEEIVSINEEGPEVLQFNEILEGNKIFISHNLNLLRDPYSQMLFVNKGIEELTALESNENSDDNKLMEMRWSAISNSVSQLASMLAENLRIIIEPTVASRLQGDYRTGKRLNVRRLISYVASNYKKDRIWMRRTKKMKRNYHICIAVDDSSSMKDNLMTTITCHSLCLIEKALRQLEVGKLMICKFGRTVKVLNDFSTVADNNVELGTKLMRELTFKQDKTDLTNLLNVVAEKFEEQLRTSSNSSHADQMLIILSDGRGVMADGLDRIKQAIKYLEFQNVTVLFLIIDDGEKSITEMKVAQFGKDGSVKLTSYMEQFPFPFYAIINGITQLPSIISTAIQQWFEFTSR